MNDIIFDSPTGPVVTLNDSGVDSIEVLEAAKMQHPEIAALVTWTSDARPNSAARSGGLIDRDRFIAPLSPYEQIRVAYDAAEDDVVASYLDSSEAMAIGRTEILCQDEDESDIWEQIAESCDLEQLMREMWRELNTVSQCYVAVWYGKKSFKVRGKSDAGVKRKKSFANLTVPLGMTVLDPLKVVPVGSFLFGQEQLAYYADPTERDVIDSWLLGDDDSGADQIIKRLIMAKYEPDYRDRKQIGNLGIDPNRLYLMNPKYVFRHTVTRPGYSRFAPIRMKSVFELLDMKHQLRAMDRAYLIGATNFILLIKKGTDAQPAHQLEIQALQSQVKTISKVPVIVGDHRLSLEIITPKTDQVLDPKRYDLLDTRIAARLWGMFVSAQRQDDSVKLTKVVARGLESRRSAMVEKLMKQVLGPTFGMNDDLTTPPQIVFHPKHIALDFDPSFATFLLDLFDRGNLSRSSVLSEIDFDEADEADKKKLEKEKFDKIFQPTDGSPLAPPPALPPGAQAPAKKPMDPKSAGRTLGGNHGQGGNGNVGRGAGKPPAPGKTPNPKTGTNKPKPSTAEEEDE